jgi:hypothetical protein
MLSDLTLIDYFEKLNSNFLISIFQMNPRIYFFLVSFAKFHFKHFLALIINLNISKLYKYSMFFVQNLVALFTSTSHFILIKFILVIDF